jgi:hypothetical protein
MDLHVKYPPLNEFPGPSEPYLLKKKAHGPNSPTQHAMPNNSITLHKGSHAFWNFVYILEWIAPKLHYPSLDLL